MRMVFPLISQQNSIQLDNCRNKWFEFFFSFWPNIKKTWQIHLKSRDCSVYEQNSILFPNCCWFGSSSVHFPTESNQKLSSNLTIFFLTRIKREKVNNHKGKLTRIDSNIITTPSSQYSSEHYRNWALKATDKTFHKWLRAARFSPTFGSIRLNELARIFT